MNTTFIQDAEKNLDHSYTVRTLLTVWWSCIDNGNTTEISTPRYLYNDDEGRKLVLTKLGTLQNTGKVSELSFFMYSFYRHLSCKIGQKGHEFFFEGNTCTKVRGFSADFATVTFYRFSVCKIQFLSKVQQRIYRVMYILTGSSSAV